MTFSARLIACLLPLSSWLVAADPVPVIAVDPVPVIDVAALMPQHGTISIAPAKKWQDGLAAGNGIMGAMLYGDPAHDTLLVNHCKLWLPAGSREVVPEAGDALPEMRRIIGEKGYDAGQKFFLQKASDQGWDGKLVWTDVYHPGFFLGIDQPQDGPVTDYARVEDFATGEVWAQWKTPAGAFTRRMFVSRTDNAVVCTTTGPRGGVSLTVNMSKIDNNLIQPSITHGDDGWITCHNLYAKGKGGFDGAVRIVATGGVRIADGSAITIRGADAVTLLVRILPWRTPLPGSQAWSNDPANPDFAGARHPARRDTVQVPGPAYDSRWMEELRTDLAALPAAYAELLAPHAAAWNRLFKRVDVDLGGSAAERAMPSETLLDLAQKEKRLPPALLERMYDAGRYVFMCSAGPETPPNLFGIWSGTWAPAWSGDYTIDTNVQLEIELAYGSNLAELMTGYFHLWDSFLPDFRRNAKGHYGCRGIFAGTRASNNGLSLHWDKGWPGNLWTPGTSWLAHWHYDHWLYTGDRAFLRDRAIPFMKECALFWEDFLKGTEGADGKVMFRPSFSAENGWGDNTAQDIEITTELLTNLIAACKELGVEADGVVRWQALLAKLPPLLVNDQGQLKEWANPNQGEKNNHRHLMHLYGAFESQQFSEENDPRLFEAARVALRNRIAASNEDATHGFMHTGLAAAGLGLGDLAFARVEELAKRRSIWPNMVNSHNGGPAVLCVDGNGATPEIVNRMLVQSQPGRLLLLPALPKTLPKGTVSGLRARGQIGITRLEWDMAAGRCTAVLTADCAQTITLVMGRDLAVTAITMDGNAKTVATTGVSKLGTTLALPQGRPVTISVTWKP